MSDTTPESYSVTVTYIIRGDSIITTDGDHTGQPPGIVRPPVPPAPQPAASAGSTLSLPPITLDWHSLKGSDPDAIKKMRRDHAAAGLYHTLIGFNLAMKAGDLTEKSS